MAGGQAVTIQEIKKMLLQKERSEIAGTDRGVLGGETRIPVKNRFRYDTVKGLQNEQPDSNQETRSWNSCRRSAHACLKLPLEFLLKFCDYIQ
jgi:hypothetical protein